MSVATTNGTHHAPESDRRVPGPLCRVEVYNVKEGDPIFVRMLGETYRGLFTHYFRGKGHLCEGKEHCNTNVHKEPLTWKGYVAGQLFVPDRKLWMPVCLEITEALELEMRDNFRRGQTWELWRAPLPDKKNPQVQGKRHDDPPAANLPPAFDITPILRTLYHRQTLPGHIPNPMPPRVVLESMEGEGPQALQEKPAERILTKEERHELMEEFMNRKKGPTEKKPGR